MDKRTQNDLLILLGLYLLARELDKGAAANRFVRAANDYYWQPMKESGASLYELLHPNERNHANDLPRPERMRKPTSGKGEKLPPEVILTIAQIAGFPDPKLAAAIALAESGGWTNNINNTPREYSVGLWQINTKVHPYSPSDMADPMKNAMAAYTISKGGIDWSPWSAYTHNKHQAFQKGVLA